MALKGDRIVYQDRIDVFLNEAATGGKIVSQSTYGSGVALDSNVQLGTVSANPSGGRVLGVLVGDVVDIDTTRYMLNTQKNEVVKGSKVKLIQEGWIVTSDIEAGTVTAGAAAYVGNSGNFATAAAIAGYGCAVTEEANALLYPMVGKFESTKDENGYAKITVNIK